METSSSKKIQSFQTLTAGWSFGEGVAFQAQILNKANQLVKSAHAVGFHDMDVFPGLNGEIMVTLYSGEQYWEFTIGADENVTFVYEVNDEVRIYEEGLPFEFAVSMITNLGFQNNMLVGARSASELFLLPSRAPTLQGYFIL